ncbi:hypothetical protein EMIT0P258_10542 [Pseudomonas sp. IT-P258]
MARSGLHQLQQNSSLYKRAEYTTAPILQTTPLPIGFLVGTSLKFSLLKVRRYGFFNAWTAVRRSCFFGFT